MLLLAVLLVVLLAVLAVLLAKKSSAPQRQRLKCKVGMHHG